MTLNLFSLIDTSTNKVAISMLPKATSSTLGVVSVGNGLNVSSGVISVGDLSATYSTVSHTHSTSDVSGLGTAATKDTGTGSGNIPILNSNGKLANSVIPSIAISDTFTVASESDMLALSAANIGDVAIRTDLNKSFILSSNADNGYATLSNWKELLTPTDAVLSVNGNTGAVTLDAASVGAVDEDNIVTSIASSSTDTTVPSAKAVYSYSAPISHTHAITDITGGRYDGTITGDGTTTLFTITHNLGIKDVLVEIISPDDYKCLAPVKYIGTTSIQVAFNTAPSIGDVYRVIVRR